VNVTTLQAVELGVLGPLRVLQDGAPVAIPGAKPRAVLTMLGLHHGSVVSADTLVELLWGENPPRTAAKALQTHISSLRRALGDGFVLTQGTGWALAESEVDASLYKSAARLGRDAAATGDISQAVARFEEALALWRGIPELPDGRRGTSEKTRWIEGHAALVEDRADALLATSRAAEIIGELEAAVAEAPLRERRWGQLMLALYRAGRQGDALGAYQRARTMLADELGIDPGPELRRLETAIVAQDVTLDVVVAQQHPSVMRAVTFLLTDIEGSTAAWEADAAAMAVALARHDELAEQVVTSRGGRLIKTRGEGDATFSVFERPSAAAAAAMELQDAITHEQWGLREPMRIRIALHTGEVELRDGDYFGRAVNRAARLRSLAAGGQILCSGATAELVVDSLPDDVVLADLGLRELRNLARPEHVFELRLETAEEVAQPPTSDAPPMERPGLPSVLIGTGPFVGRGSELERLLSAWQTSLGGVACAALIAGEPGVGKTRLAGEWSRQAYEQGAVVLYGRCDEDLGAPYQPFAEALRSLVPCVGTSRLRGLRGVEALLPLVPGLVDEVPDLAAPTRADPDTERYALFDAVVALLEMASTEAPVVLVLDDLHWAAKPTLLLLRHLLRFGDRARVQIVGTYRSTDLDRSHPLAAMLADLHRDGTANRISLGGLDEDDVSAYVAKAGYDDEELGHALATVTGGNPFFLIEALRHVDESGGVWDPSTLPQGVREAVSRRLTRLPIETNKALAAAAVVGSRFALDLVERVVGDDLVDAFDEASKAGIVIEEPGGRYRFNHALVRQSLLAELPSMRRMRLHQRIATTLEDERGDDDELLAELAHHYFECAWAGNAAKAVEYCRRAADQAMARLAYEGAADLYDHALHALDEIDDELPDRDDQIADLLLARCEALLAAGDVTSAAGAVSQLQQATVDSARLSAWATCFDGQLSVLVHPERLDDVEAALGAAAQKLAEIDDAAGEAKAHTVRATCLARLGRIGDCEIALDDALTAARRAREHRRVNAVLAGAPLAALWGPNPVPRAGGRCLDVVRLLRITTDSPAVEATSTRCQAVLEAFRGRDAAARRMIDSARRTVTELGLRHALLEVEQFAGIVELVLDDPAAAEPRLRQACNGFRRMGLDADTAETAALLGRACLALNREAEADELCTESERLAGHALKPAIAWRTVRAQLLSRGNDHDEARRVAQAAITLAERTDALVDHGDACLALATVLGAAGDAAGARSAAERAANLYERKGAAALADKARSVLDERVEADAPTPPEAPVVETHTAAVHASERVMAAIAREAWDEFEQMFAPAGSVESRRKIVGFKPTEFASEEVMRQTRRDLETGIMRANHVVMAVRGERLALARMTLGTVDVTPGAPQDEFLQVYGVDDEGRINLQVWFDLDDMDAALAALDVLHARFEDERSQERRLFGGREIPSPPASPRTPNIEFDNECVRAIRRMDAAVDGEAWDEAEHEFATEVSVESHRKIVGFPRVLLSPSQWISDVVRSARDMGGVRHRHEVVAVRGERLVLTRLKMSTEDVNPGAPEDEMLQLFGLDDEGRIALHVWFDLEDIDAAIAELDALHARFEEERSQARRLENAASRLYERFKVCYAARDWSTVSEMLADDILSEDRRHPINSGVRQGRDALIAELSALAEVGIDLTTEVVATRGERLVLSRIRTAGRDQGPDGFGSVDLDVLELGVDGRFVARIVFNEDDFDAAIAELDARYLAGEAAACAQTWSGLAIAFAGFNRRELPKRTPDWFNIDHRRGAAFAAGDITTYVRDLWNDSRDINMYVEVVHRLSNLGVVITQAAHGTSQHGFEAEWRENSIFTFDGDLVSRIELFDEADLDAAIARFEQLGQPARRLENAASRVFENEWSHFAARDWDALAELVAYNYSGIDHRRVVRAENQHGRDVVVKDLQAAADVGFTISMLSAIAIRGERLVLARVRASGRDPKAIQNDALNVVEIDAEERIVAAVTFDLEDIDAALAELDARYLAGEAAAYSRTWSVIAGGHAALNRHELPPTTPDCVSIDHRRGAAFAPGDLIEYFRAGWELGQDIRTYVEVVHRLSELGAVCTHAGHGVSHEGFDAEWHGVDLLTVEGDMVNRCEAFDDADLDAAIARFDELSRPAPRLENAASQVAERFMVPFTEGDWDAVAEMLADNFSSDDRRRVVGAGVRLGRDAQIADVRAIADLWIMRPTVMATRGDRLVLMRVHFSGRDQGPAAFLTEALSIVEMNADERIVATVAFGIDDIDAAIAELDTRYLAGEAAAHAHTWSVIMQGYASLNRRELPPTTPDWVNIDHRRGTSIAPGGIPELLTAAWNVTSDLNNFVEAVHRLDNLGGVVTHVANETSQEGFHAEWRVVSVFTVEGDMVNRCEVFDEADLDTAIARFEELNQPTSRLENAASRVDKRFQACFAARDWDVMAKMLSDGFSIEDRRRVVNMGNLQGRDAELGVHAYAVVGSEHVTSTIIATRAQRLTLSHYRFSDRDQRPDAFRIEMLVVVEIDADDRMAAVVVFDADDFDAAFAELDARYLAGEASAHAHTWSLITNCYAAMNRHEIPTTTTNPVSIDHRKGTPFARGDVIAYTRAAWSQVPDLSYRLETVHQLSDLGAVITHTVRGTSQEGFEAEWREINLMTFDGDMVTRSELFDEADIHAALTQFDQLGRSAPRLDNAADQVSHRFMAHFAAGDWDAMAEILADNLTNEDRRRVVSTGVFDGRDALMANMRAVAELWSAIATRTAIATRGRNLVLVRIGFSRGEGVEAFLSDFLIIVEIDADERISANIVFDLEDIDAAIAELDARYVAGEAADHAHVWSVIVGAYGAINRRELPATTPDFEDEDHRRGAAFAAGDMIEYLRAGWDLGLDISFYIEAVHRLSGLGAVVTHKGCWTSREGFDAEWREVMLFTADGDSFSRCEVFDEADVDAAIARFEELSRPVPRLENAASQAFQRAEAYIAARDWDGVAEIAAENFSVDDRRRVVNAGIRYGRDAAIRESQSLADVGFTLTTVGVMATRGARLALVRVRASVSDPEAILNDAPNLVEIDADGRIVAIVVFDPDDFAAAIAELDARYLAGEAAAHSETWLAIAEVYAALNRGEMPTAAPDLVDIDHRSLAAIGSGDLMAYLQAASEDTPRSPIYIETVHRLTDLGAVTTHVAKVTSREGFDAEWRITSFFTVGGDLVNRYEIFDEDDLEAALAGFEEHSRPAARLENAATQVYERLNSCFAERNWAAMTEILASDVSTDDRRRVVNAGLRTGRDAVIAEISGFAEIGVTAVASDIIATRGRHLSLSHIRSFVGNQPVDAFQADAIHVVEIDADERISAIVVFDVEDIEAAFQELDSRYLASEAAAHSHVWSVIVGGFGSIRRSELPPTTPDCVSIDHRRTAAFAPGELNAYFRAAFDLTADSKIYVEAVHRLNDAGAVCTHVVHGVSHDGFAAEWREVDVLMVEDNIVNHCEIFDEADIDAALAKFEELSPHEGRLKNAASQASGRYLERVVARDWDTIAERLADDYYTDDRRHVVGGGIHGRDAEIASVQVQANLGVTHATPTVIAVRGERLALSRVRYSGHNQELGAFVAELLIVFEMNVDGRFAAAVAFDLDDLDAAVAELDARYLAGEAAVHADTWSVITSNYAAFNRHELPTADWDTIDHRRATPFASSTMTESLRAIWDLTPALKIHIEAVHRLNSFGAVITHEGHGSSQEGFDAEWRAIDVLTVEGDRITSCEIFDEADLDAALARFEELHPQTRRLENAASQVVERFWKYFAGRHWDAMAETMADDFCTDDRRRVANAGVLHGRAAHITNMRAVAEVGFEGLSSTVIATRGQRLALIRFRTSMRGSPPGEVIADVVGIVEIGADNRLVAAVHFDSDDIDAAFEKLDARYLAGEAGAHADTWSVMMRVCAALNAREIFATTADFVDIDHRSLAAIGSGDLKAYIRAALNDGAYNVHIEAVHRLGDLGAVVTLVSSGTSQGGFDGEWRMADVFTVEGDLISRCEMFDEADVDAALARFDELDRSPSP
jgi:DNA-binding SARP family transcriptional activator